MKMRSARSLLARVAAAPRAAPVLASYRARAVPAPRPGAFGLGVRGGQFSWGAGLRALSGLSRAAVRGLLLNECDCSRARPAPVTLLPV